MKRKREDAEAGPVCPRLTPFPSIHELPSFSHLTDPLKSPDFFRVHTCSYLRASALAVPLPGTSLPRLSRGWLLLLQAWAKH